MNAPAADVVVTCGSCGSKLQVSPGATARTEKCPTCGTRLQIPIAPEAQAASRLAQKPITIDAPPAGTFLFFPAAAAVPEIRSAPVTGRAGTRQSTKQSMDAIWIGAMTIAALLLGMVASIAIVRYGGTGIWVVKRSAVAWGVGMLTAAGMIVASSRRDTSIRLLALTTAAASVVMARQIAGPAAFGPVDLLLVALAMGGAICGFILAEDNLKSPVR